MGLIFDLVMILLLILIILAARKRGFVRILIETLGYIVAVLVAALLSAGLSNSCYDLFVRPPITRTVEAQVAKAEGPVVDQIHTALEALPKSVNALMQMSGVTTSDVEQQVGVDVSKPSVVADAVADAVAPPVTQVLKSLLFIAFLVILLILVRLLARSLNKIFSVPVLGTLNRFLGGLLGLVQGFLLIFVLCILVYCLSEWIGNGTGTVFDRVAEGSYLYRLLIPLNPLARL